MNELPHLRLEDTAQRLSYTSPGGGGRKSFELPPRNRSIHAGKLKSELDAARKEAARQQDEERRVRPAVVQWQPEGMVLTFESDPSFDLKLESLDAPKSTGIELVSVRETGNVMQAKVFVPNGKLSHFFERLRQYEADAILTVECDPVRREQLISLNDPTSGFKVKIKTLSDGKLKAWITCPATESDRIEALVSGFATVKKVARRNSPLIDSIRSIRLAVVEEFWQDSSPFPQSDAPVWWEVWIRSSRLDAQVRYDRFTTLATAIGLRVAERFVTFPENAVLLAYGTAGQLSMSIDLLTMLSELRRAKELATPYVQLSATAQKEFVTDFLDQLIPPPQDAPAVCILDTGANRGHPLLSVALAEDDVQAVDEKWGTADHDVDQHGTGMAGIALYGCLTEAMTNSQIRLRHCLESVKLLPPPSQQPNEPDVYGAVTQQAVGKAVIRNPNRNRAICMAVTADDTDQGMPSSWSSAVDDICAGTLDEIPKLMFISAGNVGIELFSKDYRYHEWNCQNAGIEDPAQAWNAITVGAYTEKVVIQDATFAGWEPIAESGGLCPTSRTSLAWSEQNHFGWPIKPDIVLEGGNYAERAGERSFIDDLSLLTTILHPTGRLLETTRDTSPATAAAARIAAIIWSQYPHLRPETVRALLVHSAQWTPAMLGRFPGGKKADIHDCLRCYGYGVPDLGRAMHSVKNRATLIYEGELQPFDKNARNEPATKEWHLHSLPWPSEVLQALPDNSPVTMRVTLSYFIEPSPGSVGWQRNQRYQSHGLRFDVRRPLAESVEKFKQRISSAQWENPSDRKSRPKPVQDTSNWVVGSDGRTHGSIHSDWWKGSGAELAACDHIAVYPVTGWWRERAHLGHLTKKARYSLVVSIESPVSEVDLYTPITSSTKVETEILNSW